MSIRSKTIQTISFWLSLFLFSLAFLLTRRYTFQLDLTRNQRNTLSSTTKEILGKLKDTIILNYYVSSSIKEVSLFPQKINNFLEVYENASPYIIYRELGEENLSVPLSEIGLEAQQTVVQRDGVTQGLTYYSGIELIYAGKRALFPYVIHTEDLEYILTTAIDRIINPFSAEIGIIFAEPEDTLKEGYQTLGRTLANYNLREIEIDNKLNFKEMPLLIIIGSSLLSEEKVTILKHYLVDGGSLLISSGGTNLDVLQTGGKVISLENSPFMNWLASLGIIINANLVIDPLSATTINTGQEIIPYPAILTLSRNNLKDKNPVIRGLSKLVFGWMSSLSLESLEPIKAEVLATTSSQGLSLSKGINAEPSYILKWLKKTLSHTKQIQGEALPLAIALQISESPKILPEVPEVPEVPEERERVERRVIILSGRYAFHDALLSFGGQNLDLLIRSVEWLLKRDQFTELKKERLVNTWNLSASERVKMHERLLFINAFLLPIFLLGLGVLVKIKRMRRS